MEIKAYLNDEAVSAGAQFRQPRQGDAGFDLCASGAITLFDGKQAVIPTGLFLELPPGRVGIVKDRSSMAIRRIYTHAGVIDASYRGEIGVVMDNQSGKNYHIEPGQRIAQLIIVEAFRPTVRMVGIEELTQTARGTGNFGSTGK